MAERSGTYCSQPAQAVVTGAFSYIGRYVAKCFIEKEVAVRTLTRNPSRDDPFDGRVAASPLNFSDTEGLHRPMEGAGLLYNTPGFGSVAGRPPSSRRLKIPG